MSQRKRGRITVQSQPTKETRTIQKIGLIPGVVISGIFVVIGVVKVIPMAGLFGVVWTLIAATGFVSTLFALVKKNGLAHRVGYDVETGIEQDVIVGLMDDVDQVQKSSSQGSAQERLEELRQLYESRLITSEEYENKRQEILKEI